MKIVTWNVNSVASRLSRVEAFLQNESPDVLCLQELKCMDEKFPLEAIKKLNYHAAVYGQKTYNGVAVISKTEPLILHKGLGEDPAARLLAVKVGPVNVVNVYCPNGQAVGSDKYTYKLEWFKQLKNFLQTNFKPTDSVVLTGDFNVAPEDRDVHNPDAWRGKILFSEPEKTALKEVCQWGLVDTFRLIHPETGHYSWWDYRAGCFPRNMGLRIDFVLATDSLAKRCLEAHIFRDERKGDKPSDHAPVMASFRV